MKIKVSAPGKLMLFGEHAVVYNRPAIVTAVSSRIHVEIEKINCGFKIESPQVKDFRFVDETIRVFRKYYPFHFGLLIKTKNDFSTQYGFGSSSAVIVALLYGLSKIAEKNLMKNEIYKLGHEINLNVQGIGSGFDIAAATFGKTLYFLTGGKIIEEIKIDDLPLIVGYSGVKADTPLIVKKLKEKISKNHRRYEKIFNEIAGIVDKAKNFLTKRDWQKVGHLMKANHRLLQDLGVSTKKLDQMCQSAIAAGAYGAKLSGAGGGDCMIAIVPKDKSEQVKKAIIQSGGEIIKVYGNAQGVNLE